MFNCKIQVNDFLNSVCYCCCLAQIHTETIILNRLNQTILVRNEHFPFLVLFYKFEKKL
ncbi:hypothetical protein LEP1GSC035_4436 [Leptospira noguchii str. 2007001578]|uniref:Uncharacterized protein n=2 Tax=Leptospira noguchii TaxID=28182 RepID=M6Y6M1_9LEPT|nr:hypothetical protein LEP1GSC035_4436 [Leptospira noguchii str. 2007001578]EMO89390.1 hypothetical protein LEP1GSC024_1170 [Leptospira noguchii str. 2001034031]